MTVWKPSLVALVVVSGGVVAALPFQRSAPSSIWQESRALSSPQVRWRDPNIVLQIPGRTERSPAERFFSGDSSEPGSLERHPSLSRRSVGESAFQMPEATESLEGSGEPAPDAGRPWPPSARAPEQSSAGAVRHTIVDGDTLEALAARYLGDAARWVDIYEANRPVLARPDVLPLGAVLRISVADRLGDGASRPSPTANSDAAPW